MDAAELDMTNTPYVKRDGTWPSQRQACAGSPTSVWEVVESPHPSLSLTENKSFVQFLGRMMNSDSECLATA